jgi:nucleotide-binding universal stress UspA family protein
MNNVKKILVPTDLSRHSRAGLRLAISLAAKNGAELIVLHVASEIKPWEIPDELGFFNNTLYKWEIDRIVREAALDLSRFLEKHTAELSRVPAGKKRVLLGNVAQRIVEIAREENAGLIVMSPRAHGGVKRFFLGSVTDKVTRHAPCPVLSVCSTEIAQRRRGRQIPWMGGLLQGAES